MKTPETPKGKHRGARRGERQLAEETDRNSPTTVADEFAGCKNV